jgi:Flp pilus assembly protein TadD
VAKDRRKTLLGAIVLLIAAVAGFAVWQYVWPQYTLSQAEQAIAAGDLERAEQKLQQLQKRDPRNPKVCLLRAQVLRRLHRPDQAEEALRQIKQLGYPERELTRELVLNEAAKQFRPPIAAALLQYLNDKPDDEEVLQALAEGHARTQNWAKAEEYLTRLLEHQPDNVEMQFERGQVRRANKTDSHEQSNERAAEDFREVLRRVPDHFEARLGLAQCLLADARIAPAKREFARCRELQPQHLEPLIGLAVCAVEEQDWRQAQALLEEILKRRPDSLTVLTMQGDLCLRRQQYPDAISYFQKILKLDPMNKSAHLKLAQAYRLAGKLPEAKDQEEAYERLRVQGEQGASSR